MNDELRPYQEYKDSGSAWARESAGALGCTSQWPPDDGVTNDAVLLFGTDPQKHALSAIVKCAHYHGTEYAKPIPSHQVFDGPGARYTLAKSPGRNAPEMRQMRQPNGASPRTTQSADNAPETRQTREDPQTRQKPDKRDTTAASPKRAQNSPTKKTSKIGRRKKK